MARADASIGLIEAGANIGYSPEDTSYGAQARAGLNVGRFGFGKGTPGRRGFMIWGASALWLLLVWRAVEGY